MEKIEASRNFANKLWNCCKFVGTNALQNVEADELQDLGVRGPITKDEFDQLALPERYIVSQCHTLVSSVTADLELYLLGAAGSKVYDFLWDQFADWYIEISKTRLYEGFGGSGTNSVEAKKARRVLVYVLDTSLRLLHPYMPFVTEHLWHHLPRQDPTSGSKSAPHALMLSDWPQLDDDVPLVTCAEAVSNFECFQALTRSIRNARAEYNVEPGKRIRAFVVANGRLKDEIQREIKSLASLAKLDIEKVAVLESGSAEAKSAAQDAVQLIIQDGVEAYLPLSGLIDVEKERKRLEKQNEKIAKDIEKLDSRLKSPGFLEKAPPQLVAKVRAELAGLEDQVAKIQSSLAALK
jgi:valyl-tRNA synthetase